MKEYKGCGITFDIDGKLKIFPLDDRGDRTNECIVIEDEDVAMRIGVALIRAMDKIK